MRMQMPISRGRCAVAWCALFAAVAAHAQLLPTRPPSSVEPKTTTPLLNAPSARGSVVPSLPPAVPAAAAPGAAIEPSWPQKVELLAGERSSMVFAVGRPGPIRVTLQASGVALVLSLRRPDGRVVEHQGSGQIVIEDAADAADIARGLFWGVGMRTAQEAPRAAQGVVKGRIAPQVVARGSLDVQHPGADAASVKAAAHAMQSQAQQPAAPPKAPPGATLAAARAAQQQAQAAHDKEVALRHSTELAKLRPTLAPQVHAQLDQRIALRLQGQTVQQAAAMTPVRLIQGPAASSRRGAGLPMEASGGLLVVAGGTGTAQGAATGGVAPVGSGGGAAAGAAPPAPPPVLSATSTGEGDPGTPVMLSGSDLGNAPGLVQFIVGNGKFVTAPITYWSSTQIVTEVPYADGVPNFNGQVYVQRADGVNTNLQPFRFLPLYDVAEIGLPDDQADRITAPSIGILDGYLRIFPPDPAEIGHTAAMFWGFNGDDKFYMNSQTRNDWVVTGARLDFLRLEREGHGGAYLVDTRPGTQSPYVQVRWWLEPGIAQGGSNSLKYSIRVGVKRPKNLPCAVGCSVL